MPPKELSRNTEKLLLMLLEHKTLSKLPITLPMQLLWLELIERDLNIRPAYGYQETQSIFKQKNQYQKLRKINNSRTLVKLKELPEMLNINHPSLLLLPKKLLLVLILPNGRRELEMMIKIPMIL